VRSIGNVAKDAKIRGVASGTLSNGIPVCVNSDGTVSAVEEESGSENIGTAVQFETGNLIQPEMAYDSANGKFVVVYRDGGNSNYGTACVGTVSGSSVSFGTPVVFYSNTTLDPTICYDSNAGKMVIAYSDNASSPTAKAGTAIVGTVSGTTMTFGSAVQFESDRTDTPRAVYDENSQKAVILYENNQSDGTAIVGTVSGTTISFGTPFDFNNGATTVISGCFDPDTNQIIATYSDSGNSDRGTARVGSVSGTSISFGAEVVFETGDINRGSTGTVYDTVNSKVVISYSDNNDTQNGKAIVGTVSGTSISFGTAVTWETGQTQYNDATYHAAAGKVIVHCEDENDGGLIQFAVGTVSGTSITFTTAANLTSVESSENPMIYDSTNKIAVFSFRNEDISGAPQYSGYAATLQIDYTLGNLTSDNFIGFSDSGYLSGQNVGVDSTCSVNREQTGLTAGEKYYVQNDGSLSTTPDTPSVEAGTAISSTEILVKG